MIRFAKDLEFAKALKLKEKILKCQKDCTDDIFCSVMINIVAEECLKRELSKEKYILFCGIVYDSLKFYEKEESEGK